MMLRCIHKNEISLQQRQQCLSLMAPQRRAQVERITHSQTRESSICGEWLAKTMLSEVSGQAVEDISLARDQNGKPYAENLPLYFSISHSGEQVACVISDQPVGLDIEEIAPRDPSVARRICSEKEMEFIFSKEEDVLHRFLLVWTAKEAAVKLSGVGIKGMREVDYFALQPRLETKIEDGCVISVVR